MTQEAIAKALAKTVAVTKHENPVVAAAGFMAALLGGMAVSVFSKETINRAIEIDMDKTRSDLYESMSIFKK